MNETLFTLKHSEEKFISINGEVQSCHKDFKSALVEASKLLGEKRGVVTRMHAVAGNNCN